MRFMRKGQFNIMHISQCQAVGEPAPRTWDDYEKSCMMTYHGGYRDAKLLDAFQHGMRTVFNLLRDEFPEAEICRNARLSARINGIFGD